MKMGVQESQFAEKDGYIGILDTLCDSLISPKTLVVSFNEEMPLTIRKEMWTSIIDKDASEASGASGILVDVSEPSNPPTSVSRSRRSRRFRNALQTAPLKELTRNKASFVKYCQNPGNSKLEEPLARLFGCSTPDFGKKEIVLYKRMITLRKSKEWAHKNQDTLRRPRKVGGGINTKCQVQPILRDFLVSECGLNDDPEGFSRIQVSKAIPGYIKSNNLGRGRNINLDEKLKLLLDPPRSDEPVTYFSMQKLLAKLFIK